MNATLFRGHRYCVLNIVDEGLRKPLKLSTVTSLPARWVLRVLDALVAEYGQPQRLRVDNGAEVTKPAFVEWCERRIAGIIYIQPDKPNQNAYIERFSRSLPYEVLDVNLFKTLSEVRQIEWTWQISYREDRPHGALGKVPPSVFKRLITPRTSIDQLCV